MEFPLRLRELIPLDRARKEVLAIYDELLEGSLPVTREVAQVAFDLRLRATQRIPNGDALMAATAKLVNATLVHRDPHLGSIPETFVPQLVLPTGPAPERRRRRH